MSDGSSWPRLRNTSRDTLTVEAMASRTPSSPSLTSRTAAFLGLEGALPFREDPLGTDFGLRDKVASKLLARCARKTDNTSINGRDSRRCNVRRVEQMSWRGVDEKVKD